MPVTTFNVDDKMDKTLEELKIYLGATSKSEVLRKAVALLNIAKNAEQPDGSIVLKKDGAEVKIIIK